MNKFYLQVQKDSTITDAITFPHGNYVEVELEVLPVGVYGGWWKLENGVLVEYPELKPIISESDQLKEVKAKQFATDKLVAESNAAQQDLLELLIDMGVI